MPFEHDDRITRILVNSVPQGSRTTLVVSCGTGRLARRLALRGIQVDATDQEAHAIAAARHSVHTWEVEKRPRFWCIDATEVELPPEHYDFIASSAPWDPRSFATISKLRSALAPAGVLTLATSYRLDPEDPVPAGGRREYASRPAAEVAASHPSLAEIREAVGLLLPDAAMHTLPERRVVVVFHRTVG